MNGPRTTTRLLDPAASAVTVFVGIVFVALAAQGALTDPGPSTLDPTGAFADDGWTRACRTVVLLATGLTAFGLVRARGLRRLIALGLLSGAALGVVLAAGSLDLGTLWAGVALATTLAPLAIVVADERRAAARHGLAALLLGALACGVLATAFLALGALSGSTHVLEIGFLVTRFDDTSPLALTAVRAAAVAVAMLAAWAPFHLGLPELWGEGSAPLAGWLAIVWPWAGWSVLVRLSGGLAPALDEWTFDAAAAVSLFLALGALLPGAAALAEERLGRLFALLGIGALSELLLAVHARGADAAVVAQGLWGYALAWIVGAAALSGARSRLGNDRLDGLAGLSARLPRTALALAVAALLWVGLPGTFSLGVRWSLWQQAAGASPFVLLAVAGGAFLRLLAVARLLALLYFRAPSAQVAVTIGPPPPWHQRGRWGIVFAAALALEVWLALGAGHEVVRIGAGSVLTGG